MSCIFLCFFYFPSFSEYHFDGVPALNEKLFVKCFVKCTNFVIPKADTANNNNLEVTVSNIKMNHIVTFIKKTNFENMLSSVVGNTNEQKQPSRYVLRKRYSEYMQ